MNPISGREPVGIDPVGAGALVARLEEADAALDAQAARVQALLDEAGHTSTVALDIRSAGRTCGDWAGELRRRAVMVQTQAPGGARPSGVFGLPNWRDALREPGGTGSAGQPCHAPPLSTRPQSEDGVASSPTPLGSLRTGPWATPQPALRTGPWQVLGGIGVLRAGQTQNAMAVPGSSCGQAVPGTSPDPIQDLIAANNLATSSRRRYTEEEIEGGSETLTEEERQAVRDKQAGEDYPDSVFAAAVQKLVKSAKVADLRNTGKQRGQPNK